MRPPYRIAIAVLVSWFCLGWAIVGINMFFSDDSFEHCFWFGYGIATIILAVVVGIGAVGLVWDWATKDPPPRREVAQDDIKGEW